MKIQIEFPKNGKLRSRKVVSRSNARSTGKYPSWKMGRMIQFESKHEKHAFMLLDADPAVISFHEQPCIVRFEMDGIVHKHYPDILVEFASGRELWEVKESSDANGSFIKRRTEILSQQLPSLGYTYRLVLAEQLSTEPRLRNVRQLLMFGNKPVPLMEREMIRQAFLMAESIPWQAFLGLSFSRYHASRLFLEGLLEVDLNEPLDGNSIIRMTSIGREA